MAKKECRGNCQNSYMVLRDGWMIRYCADCGAPLTQTRQRFAPERKR